MFPDLRKSLLFAFFFVFLQTKNLSFGQPTVYPVKAWVKQLQAKDDPKQKNILAIELQLVKADSASVYHLLQELEKAGPSANHYFNGRLFSLKGWVDLKMNRSTARIHAKEFYARALKEAYYTTDEEFIAYISWEYGTAMESFQEIELAATYLMHAVELDKNLLTVSRNGLSAIQYLGELLFHARLYEESIFYTRQTISWLKGRPDISDYYMLKAWNTLGQGFQKAGDLDSAMICYQISSGMASKKKDETWKAINAGFMGQIYFLRRQYDKASPLLEYDYRVSKDIDANIAGYTLQWIGRIYLIKGERDSALVKLKEALRFLQRPTIYLFQNTAYREAAYEATADAYRLQGNSDSSHHYFQLYLRLHDSLQKVTVRSSLDLAKMRIDNEKNFYAVQLLEQQIRAEELKRNFTIAAIVLLSVIAVLILLKQRQTLRYRQRLALQQKATAEAETAAAKEQLHLFTQNIIEKAALIENLQQQMKRRELNTEQHQLLEELSHQTILTEADWKKFKGLFERLHPGFFNLLKEKTPGITLAELRMAALTRLRLSTKEMASLLGISLDSVHKTRQRLRQRLQVPAEANLEESIASF